MKDDSANLLLVLSAVGSCEQFWHGQGYQLFGVAHPAFPMPTTALKDGFGEAVVACDMPEPCKFLFFDICQKRFLWTHKGVDLVLHPVIGLVLQEGDAEKFPQAVGLESLDPFLIVNKQGP